MSPDALRPLQVAAAALALGGILVLLNPDRTPTVVQIVLVTIAAAAALRVPLVSLPVIWWSSPFDRDAGDGDPAPDEVGAIRARIAGRRQRVLHGPPLPPDVVRQLRGMIRRALDRDGIDPDTEEGLLEARTRLSARAWGILVCPVESRTSRLRTLRPDPEAVARAVHAVLDEIEVLTGPATGTVRSHDRGAA